MISSSRPKVCYTVGGFLVHNHKTLLIKHKKLGFWLAPGGHIDTNELPHQTAEREFWEETGIKVKVIDPYIKPFSSSSSEYFPSPFATNLHWVCRENYQQRLKSSQPNKRFAGKVWKKGCEQHLGFVYLVEPVAGVEFKQNVEETDGIGWFSLEEIESLKTIEDIRLEANLAFELTARSK